MNPPPDAHLIHSPQYSDTNASIVLPKTRNIENVPSPAASLPYLPFRRVNASLSSLFASTSSLSSRPSTSQSAPTAGNTPASLLSPGTGQISGAASPLDGPPRTEDDSRTLILRAFVPRVAVYASADTEEIIAGKGIPGGLLALLRPYGERVQGKVTIRESNGASRTWEDFGVRFTGLRDGLEVPLLLDLNRSSSDGKKPARNKSNDPDAIPARMRTGGDVSQIESTVDRHLTYSEIHSNTFVEDYINHKEGGEERHSSPTSPFYWLYLRRLLSGLPMTPHETFSHPIACIIAISSKSHSPIEELRRLYATTNTGDQRLPQWVNNEYLRYYVLVHDEDHDDITKATVLYEQMKRHFGLHCHLLRLRSSQCVPSDDDTVRLPMPEWISAAEELEEIRKREASEDFEDPAPCLFESDVTSIKTFIREMVTQSIVPNMERDVAKWNDQVASKRRGLSGRFVSLSKRWTPFGSATRSATNPLATATSSNYDSLQGFYKPDMPEAIMRKLADYAFMLRDFRLAQSTYDLLRTDFNNDKAWKYYAGANEMTAISMLLNPHAGSSKTMENVDQMLESASYSYITRCAAPYNALRSLALGVDLLKLRGSAAADDAARWACRILENRLVGPVGHALFTERVAACLVSRRGPGQIQSWGSRRRKSAMWNILAADAWLRLEKISQAEKCVDEASRLYWQGYEDTHGSLPFDGMQAFLEELQAAISGVRDAAEGYNSMTERGDEEATLVDEPIHEESETLDYRSHRKSLSGVGSIDDPLNSFDDTGPLSPVRTTSRVSSTEDDGFE